MKRLLNRKKTIELLVLILLFTFISCSAFEKSGVEIKNYFVMDDIEPPVLLEVQSISNNQVRLVFSEEVTPYSDTFEPNEVMVEGYSLVITLTQSVKAGHQVILEGRVKDSGGNTTGITTPVWGFNNELPILQINEFSTRGEGNNPDRTELLVLSDGNVAGCVLYNGIPSSWDSMVVFDSFDVKQGDYIVVWWTTSLPEGLESKTGVYNVCARDSTGLPGYNGVLTLSKSPAQGADVMDCVVFSNGSMTYEGYGSKSTLDRAKKAVTNGWWPDIEKPINSSNSTATRSICKRVGDGSWYVCETKGSSFGSVNNAEEYIPI